MKGYIIVCVLVGLFCFLAGFYTAETERQNKLLSVSYVLELDTLDELAQKISFTYAVLGDKDNISISQCDTDGMWFPVKDDYKYVFTRIERSYGGLGDK